MSVCGFECVSVSVKVCVRVSEELKKVEKGILPNQLYNRNKQGRKGFKICL